METVAEMPKARTKPQSQAKGVKTLKLNKPMGYTNVGHFLKSQPLYNTLFDKENNQSFVLGYN